jgi:hypothetical protein
MNNDSLTSRSLNAINSVISDFHKNPYTFLYESDIQYSLFSALRERISEHVEVPGAGDNHYTLHLVYSEYLDKIDLVCINPEAVNELDTSSLKSHKGYDTYIYNLPVILGIELKYIWMGSKAGFDILKHDFEKLTREGADCKKIKKWLVLGFVQRNEEADPFLRDAEKNGRRLCLANSVKCLNRIYIITPDEIYAVQSESQ